MASSEGGRGLVPGGVPRGAASGATTNLLWWGVPWTQLRLTVSSPNRNTETVGASGRFAQNGTQGKEGVVGGLRPVSVKGVEILGGPGRFPQNVDPSRWSGRVKGTPGGRGTLKKTKSSGKGLAGRWSLCRG